MSTEIIMKPTIIAGSRVATILSTAILDSYSMESAIEFSIVSRLPVSSPTLTAEVSFFVNPFILSRASDKFPPERTLATASSNYNRYSRRIQRTDCSGKAGRIDNHQKLSKHRKLDFHFIQLKFYRGHMTDKYSGRNQKCQKNQ